MEYIEGCKINEIEEEDYEEFAKNILKFGFVTTIVHGITHGDLHSGNILFIKDEKDKRHKYKIGVIDFGIIFELTDDFRNFGFDLVTKMFEVPPRETAVKILNSSIIEPAGIFEKIPNNHKENIINHASQLIEETISCSKKANQLQLYKFLHEFKNYLSNPEIANVGIKMSDNFVKTQLVLAMSHGITLTLCKEDYMRLADQVINELFHTKMIN
jgi:predicted unusual protein kinase regulating ubiquinone biosynthesis (AarF/ABC1/UbiB family)